MTPGTRRRGSALEEAIFEAVFEQIEAVGYAKLTMEGVAAAAQTGKAALYRRWASKEELVRDALLHVLPSPAEVAEEDTVRADLLALLGCFRAVVDTTRGTVFHVLKADGEESKGLLREIIRSQVTSPIKDLIHQALRRGVARGEVRPDAATTLVAAVGPAMLTSFCLTEGMYIPPEYLRSVVDEILLPLIRV